MEIRINPTVWGGVFAMPCEIVDQHMKMAGKTQIKMLLWLFRHAAQAPDFEQIMAEFRLSRVDTLDALQYWIDCGVLVKTGEEGEETAPAQPPVPEEKAPDAPDIRTVPRPVRAAQAPSFEKMPEKQLAPLPDIKPTSQQIACRAKESPELVFLYQEAQAKLGRTIGYDGQARLLLLHDHYGLPVEVILMLIEYAVSEGKTSLAYMEKVGRDWAEKEIDTLEKAEERIAALRENRTLWGQLRQHTGISTPRPTTAQEAYLNTWSVEYGFDMEMICLAYEEMANHTEKISFPYLNKVLANWHAQGYKTPAQVAAGSKARTPEGGGAPIKRGGKKEQGHPASYDLEEFSRRALYEPIVYQKKEGK